MIPSTEKTLVGALYHHHFDTPVCLLVLKKFGPDSLNASSDVYNIACLSQDGTTQMHLESSHESYIKMVHLKNKALANVQQHPHVVVVDQISKRIFLESCLHDHFVSGLAKDLGYDAVLTDKEDMPFTGKLSAIMDEILPKPGSSMYLEERPIDRSKPCIIS